jgi:SAM-dependent methyltransferase
MSSLAVLVCAHDGHLDAPSDRWMGHVTDADRTALARVTGPAIDVGCGPGRIVLALAERGTRAMGIDVTPHAVAHARERGATVLQRSVFDRVPGAGRWATALLLDGNVGIGGDPVALLRRVAMLVRIGGAVLVELEPPGTPTAPRIVRLDIGDRPGPWFELAPVTDDEIDALADLADLAVRERWAADGRWFAALERTR